jgi:hypothetical protein
MSRALSKLVPLDLAGPMDVALDLVVVAGLVARADPMAVALDLGLRLVVGADPMAVALDLGLRLVVGADPMAVALDLFVLPLLVRHLAPPSALVPISGL